MSKMQNNGSRVADSRPAMMVVLFVVEENAKNALSFRFINI